MPARFARTDGPRSPSTVHHDGERNGQRIHEDIHDHSDERTNDDIDDQNGERTSGAIHHHNGERIRDGIDVQSGERFDDTRRRDERGGGE